MYQRQNVDEYLQKEFDAICACSDSKKRIMMLNKFFHLKLDNNRLEDYEVCSLSSDPVISTVISDKKNNYSYVANFENHSQLIGAKSKHIKFINIYITMPNYVEREKTFYRFDDSISSNPLHDEVYAIFENRYRLTLLKKYPSWYRPIEEGIYLTLSDFKKISTKYHSKITNTSLDFFHFDTTTSPFEFFVEEFIKEKQSIFEKIIKKLAN